jgi:membrane protein
MRARFPLLVCGHWVAVEHAADHMPDEGPTDLPARSWWSALKRSAKEYKRDNLTDSAAALTYYATLAIFPALIVLVALVGVLGEYPETTNALLRIVRKLGPESAVDTFRQPITQVVRNKGGAGALLGVGLLAAIWSASGYVGAFTRAANQIYEVEEGRPFWKLRPLQVAMTLLMIFGATLVAVAIVVTGPLASAVGDVVGLGDTTVSVWNIAKWPLMAVVVITMFAVLYYAAPNVQLPRFRWLTPGGVLALVIWVVASVAFGIYVANFGSYNSTYGTIGGVVVFLVWLWITNLAILVGAEFNAELERSRELEHGDAAAALEIQLEPRDPPRHGPGLLARLRDRFRRRSRTRSRPRSGARVS